MWLDCVLSAFVLMLHESSAFVIGSAYRPLDAPQSYQAAIQTAPGVDGLSPYYSKLSSAAANDVRRYPASLGAGFFAPRGPVYAYEQGPDDFPAVDYTPLDYGLDTDGNDYDEWYPEPVMAGEGELQQPLPELENPEMVNALMNVLYANNPSLYTAGRSVMEPVEKKRTESETRLRRLSVKKPGIQAGQKPIQKSTAKAEAFIHGQKEYPMLRPPTPSMTSAFSLPSSQTWPKKLVEAESASEESSLKKLRSTEHSNQKRSASSRTHDALKDELRSLRYDNKPDASVQKQQSKRMAMK